ncbi:hypothetical protein FS837_012751 [Tulasnella sp. UAMH 9824]|nr:hypothetical protein FS837_012751 [Tulasnella sp. UAMH 9824]
MDSLPLELKIAVFKHLRKADLLSSALVCRAWRDVAWDEVLWRTFSIRFSGLLEALIDPALWSATNGLNDQNHDFTPLTSDSNRFPTVAAKAARIDLDVTIVDSLAKVMSELASSAPGKVLFPALHTLDCGEFDDKPQGELAHTVFTGSPIRRISIDGGPFEGGTVYSRRLLTSLLVAHPQVQEVTAFQDRLPATVGIPEFWLLPNLLSLTYSGFISYGEWAKVIQECRVLNEVRLAGYTRQPIPLNPPSISTRSLRRLNLRESSSFELNIAILESTDAPHLMALDVGVAPYCEEEEEDAEEEAEHPSASRARSAFRLLAKRSQKLKSLVISTSIKLGAEILAAFSSLTRLRISDSTLGCQLDDSGVELLCRSLPNLGEFYLSYWPHSEDGGHTKITPKSLGYFSRHCQDLTSLGLPVTATKPEDFVGSILTELVAFREKFQRLEFTTLTLLADRTKDFVSFLIVQCPRLTLLAIHRLGIPDREVSDLTREDMEFEIEDAYFRAQVAL